MHRNNTKKHARLYLRQGILSLLLLCLTLYFTMVSSLTQTLFPAVVTEIEALSSEAFRNANPIIQLNCDTIHYTGYDNYSQNKVTGYYYYAIENRRCLLILVDATSKEPADTIKNFKGTVKLTENLTLFNELTSHISKDIEWSARSLQELSIPVIASQPDFHFLPTVILGIGLLVCFFVFGYGTVSNFYYYRKYF